MKMKALSTDAGGELVHPEAAVLGSPLFSNSFPVTEQLFPDTSTTEPFTTRTKNARRAISKVLSLCGAGDDTLDDRDPGEPPVPQGWTKLCDDDPIESTAPCDLDEISYRNDRTDDEVEEKPTVPAGTCTLDTIEERLREVRSACEHEYFPHPTIRRYDNKTDCLDYRHLARALRDDEFIESCSAKCASAFIPVMVDCNVVLNALADHGEEYLGPGKSLFPKKVNVLAPMGDLCGEPTPRNCSAGIYDGVFNFTLFDGERQESIAEYAGRLLRIAVAVVVKGMKRGEVMVAYVNASAAFLAWVLNIIAMASWYNMKKSIKWIRIGWACAFLAPFLISTYPMKTFIDLNEANGVVLAFRDTLNQHFLDEAVQAADYADARANASHVYMVSTLDEARTDIINQQIATQRDFERFGAEAEDYSEETQQAMMDTLDSQRRAVEGQIDAANVAYGRASEDASEEAEERREQTAGVSGMIQDKLMDIHTGLYKTCEILDETTEFVNDANEIDNIVPWFIIKAVEDFLNDIPTTFGWSSPRACLPFWPHWCIPAIGFKIPLPWAIPVVKLRMVFWLVPSAEVIPDIVPDQHRALPCLQH
jgi:hypothetical protein